MTGSLRWVDTDLPRPAWRVNASYNYKSRLSIGLEYNPNAGEVIPTGNLFLLKENDNRPSVIVGFSSDRIGSPEGYYQFYGVVAKYVPFMKSAPYVALQYSEWDGEFNYPFGITIPFGTKGNLQAIYDGNRSHLMGTVYLNETFGVTALWVWYERVGVALFFGV